MENQDMLKLSISNSQILILLLFQLKMSQSDNTTIRNIT